MNRPLNSRQAWFVVFGGLALLCLPPVLWPDTSILLIAVALAAISGTTLAFQLYGWRTPEHSVADGAVVPSPATLRMAIFLAARKEATVLASTLQRMVTLRHPSYRVYVVIDHRDDPETLEIARRFEAEHPQLIRVVAYPDVPTSSKPIALNEAMRQLVASGERWDVVGVADAEDRFHVDLLATVDHLCRTTGAGIVQGAVQLVNFETTTSGHHVPDGYLVAFHRWLGRVLGLGAVATPPGLRRIDRTPRFRRWLGRIGSGWWRASNCLEYFKWFTSRLKLQAAAGVIPLGGNTVFFTREFMHDLHDYTGTWWDEDCLTEDCKIGIVASVLGHRVEVFSIPTMATYEETPATLTKFIRQRVRWMQGFIQVFFEGTWTKLPTLSQRLLAVFVLGFQFFQAFSTVLAPVAVVLALTHKAPTAVALISLVPLLVGGWNVVIDLIMMRDFGLAYAPAAAGRRRTRVRLIDYVGVALGTFLFQLALAVSAVWAVQRSLAGITNWVKTEHLGAHVQLDLEPELARPRTA